MADTKISGMTAATTLDGTELLAGVQAGGNVKITANQVKTWASNAPTLITPALGTPASGVATNLTGIAAGLTAGNVTTNANLTGVITSVGNSTSIASQTGTGTKFVVDTSPTLVTPTLGVASATSINKVALTAPATSATLTIADGKTLTASNTITLAAGADSQTFTFPAASATVAGLGTTQTFSAANTFSFAGAASTPGVTISGAPFTGGSGTTTFPQLYLNSGAAPSTWQTTGTMFGINAPSGWAGSLIDFHINGGASLFRVGASGLLAIAAGITSTAGDITVVNTSQYIWSGREILTSPAAGTLQQGAADAAGPVAQSLRAQSVVAGTADTAGQNWTIRASLSTGSGASGDIIFQTGGTGAGSTTQNTAATALTIKGATQAVVVASGKTFQLGNAATTGLTAGVLAATTNASIVITDSTGQAYRIPCII